jgi:hypothetical protein
MKLEKIFNKGYVGTTSSGQIENKLKQSNVCFVNFSSGVYIEAQQDLITSIKKFSQYDILTFSKFEEIGSPSHQDSPYEFKLFAIKKAKELGYEIVIWVDASMRLIKSIEPLIPKVKEVGIYLQQDIWAVGQWANDKALEYFGVSRDDAMKISNAYACIMIFDFTNNISSVFLDKLFECASAGLFRGQWHNKDKTESQDERCLGHRHDQTCVELLANKLGIEKQPFLVSTDPLHTGRYFTTWNNL